MLNTILHTVPGSVQNLKCEGSASPMHLTISWGAPVEQGSGIIGYRVEVLRLRHTESSESREVESVPLTPAYTKEVEGTQTQVTQGLGRLIMLPDPWSGPICSSQLARFPITSQ